MTFSQRALEAAWKAYQDTPIDLLADSDEETKRCVVNALTAALAVDGVALVPKEPTDAMKVAGGMKAEDIIFGGEGDHPTIFDAMKDVWTAMLTAASDGEVG